MHRKSAHIMMHHEQRRKGASGCPCLGCALAIGTWILLFNRGFFGFQVYTANCVDTRMLRLHGPRSQMVTVCICHPHYDFKFMQREIPSMVSTSKTWPFHSAFGNVECAEGRPESILAPFFLVAGNTCMLYRLVRRRPSLSCTPLNCRSCGVLETEELGKKLAVCYLLKMARSPRSASDIIEFVYAGPELNSASCLRTQACTSSG